MSIYSVYLKNGTRIDIHAESYNAVESLLVFDKNDGKKEVQFVKDSEVAAIIQTQQLPPSSVPSFDGRTPRKLSL